MKNTKVDILKRLRFPGVEDYELDPGVCKDAANEIERLREWIRAEGEKTDRCTYDILGEICDGCQYGRTPEISGLRPTEETMNNDLALYVTRIEGHGAEGSSFREDQCVFYVESVDENLCKVVLHEPVSAGEWPEVANAIQRALETIDGPLRMKKASDDADEERVLTIS
jgi:hypothetical protein